MLIPWRARHLAGLSLGGLVALSFADVHPVASLALLGCNVHQKMASRRRVARLLPGSFLTQEVAKQTVLDSMAEVARLDLTNASQLTASPPGG